MKHKIIESIDYHCRLCKEMFWDRQEARNHIKEKHPLENKLLNMGKYRVNRTKKNGKMSLIKREAVFR